MDQNYQLIELYYGRFTHRYPTSGEIVIAYRPPVFVWQLGVRQHLRVLELQRVLLGLSTM
jgi:hypothetical protein